MYWAEDVEGLSHLDSLPGFAPYVRGTNVLGYKTKPWEVSQELPYATPDEFNRALRADLDTWTDHGKYATRLCDLAG